MSVLPPKADIETRSRDVRFVPEADILRCSEERRYLISSSAAQARGTSLARLRHDFFAGKHDASGRGEYRLTFAAHALALGRFDTALCQRVR